MTMTNGHARTTTYEVVRMTPELASNWLARPWARQRRVSAVTVSIYATAMTEGRWLEPALDPIALTDDGLLLNGQHRLAAVVQAGWSGEMLVARDVDPALFPVIDTGRKRLAGQFINAPSGNGIAATARMALWYAERWPQQPRGRALTFDNDRLLAYADAHEGELLEAYRDGSWPARQGGLSTAMASSVVYIARTEGVNDDRLRSWLDGLATGADLSPDDPRLLLRNRMLVPGSGAIRRDSAASWQLLVRSLNAHLQGRTLARLLIHDDDHNPPRIDASGKVARAAVQRRYRETVRPVNVSPQPLSAAPDRHH